MKRPAIFAILLFIAIQALQAQSAWWVFFTDKNGTTFDPYTYFDPKAIERYRINNADLYDSSNYPLNQQYVYQVNSLSTEEIGQSRWLNAMAVNASPDQIAKVEQLPFVQSVVLLNGDMEPTIAVALDLQSDSHYYKDLQSANTTSALSDLQPASNDASITLTDQLLRMRGDLFASQGIDGTGIRIAVFDGGFHGVDSHKAFKHLRDNKRIVATWDFTKKQAKVFDNHGHGTMVLSCIAGLMGGRQLGLATGATFLLAKTEVDPEPYKEEVWWMQAVEWADKNGADIINSSLGYTKDRHYTWEMDGRSLVSRAANMAARKGILVCNSAGNSGTDPMWKIIGCPADADSILSVGGINHSLTRYEHASFSSYGPTADRRTKPNVCNFGIAECAKPWNDTLTEYNAGTSFSAPLTTGFCACAMQMLRDRKLSVMQMKEEIERSADLYPYYDYALGYGVPQATYFTDSAAYANGRQTPTFKIDERNAFILIAPTGFRPPKAVSRLDPDSEPSSQHPDQAAKDVVMLKVQDSRGHIAEYVNLSVDHFEEPLRIAVPKASIGGYTLVVHINGYTNSYNVPRSEKDYYISHGQPFEYHLIDTAGYIQDNYTVVSDRTMADNKVSDWGVGQKYTAEYYFQLGGSGLVWSKDDDLNAGLSARLGLRLMRNFRKWYALGLGLDFGAQSSFYNNDSINVWDNAIGLANNPYIKRKTLDLVVGNIELFQRIRLKTGGPFRKGLHWDLGIYGGIQSNTYTVRFDKEQNPNYGQQSSTYENVLPAADQIFNWGFTTRLAYDFAGLYARLRMSQPDLLIPRLEIGIQLSF